MARGPIRAQRRYLRRLTAFGLAPLGSYVWTVGVVPVAGTMVTVQGTVVIDAAGVRRLAIAPRPLFPSGALVEIDAGAAVYVATIA